MLASFPDGLPAGLRRKKDACKESELKPDQGLIRTGSALSPGVRTEISKSAAQQAPGRAIAVPASAQDGAEGEGA